jgi:hypothetical protein
VEKVVVGLTEDGKEKLPKPGLSSLLDVVDHLDQEAVVGVDVRPNGVELEAEGLDSRFIHGRQRHHGHVAAALQFQSNGNEWIDVAKGTDI